MIQIDIESAANSGTSLSDHSVTDPLGVHT